MAAAHRLPLNSLGCEPAGFLGADRVYFLIVGSMRNFNRNRGSLGSLCKVIMGTMPIVLSICYPVEVPGFCEGLVITDRL
jgi:hypothetical protein